MPRGARASITAHEGTEHLVLSFEPPRPALPASLTDAELSIAHLSLAGLTNPQIAAARGRSPSTVAKQINAIYRKLGVQSRTELAARIAERP